MHACMQLHSTLLPLLDTPARSRTPHLCQAGQARQVCRRRHVQHALAGCNQLAVNRSIPAGAGACVSGIDRARVLHRTRTHLQEQRGSGSMLAAAPNIAGAQALQQPGASVWRQRAAVQDSIPASSMQRTCTGGGGGGRVAAAGSGAAAGRQQAAAHFGTAEGHQHIVNLVHNWPKWDWEGTRAGQRGSRARGAAAGCPPRRLRLAGTHAACPTPHRPGTACMQRQVARLQGWRRQAAGGPTASHRHTGQGRWWCQRL